MRNDWIGLPVCMALLLATGTGWAAEEPAQAPDPQVEVASEEEAPAPASTVEPEAEAETEAATEQAEEGTESTGEIGVEPVEEAPGQTNLSVLEAEEDYVPSMVETSLVVGSLYAGTVAVMTLPSFLPDGGNWMGLVHLGAAGCAAYFPKSMGWKFIGGATFATWSAVNFLMNAREVSGGGMYQSNMAIALGVPLVVAGAYFGFEVWGGDAIDAEGAEPIVEPGEELPEPAEVEESAPPAMSLHWNIVPVGDGALTSLTLQF